VATLYLDESKAKNYIFVGVLVADGDSPRLRKRVAALKMPGQRSIHFVKEGDSRRKKLLQDFTDLGFQGLRFQSKEKNQKMAREECLRQIVRFAKDNGISNLVFERDESALMNDEKWLVDEISRVQAQDLLGFRHLARNEEPLLWGADAFAWCITRGSDWHKRISTKITNADEQTP
jgi:hypothetical protein